MRFRNASNERIRVGGARMNDAECCCESGCGASITYQFLPTVGTSTFQFYGTATLASGCTVTSWAWFFRSGHTSSSQNPTHDFSGFTGPFTVTLTITDSCGNTCEDSVVISCVPCGTTESTISVTVSGTLSDSCGDVDAMNGTFVLNSSGSHFWTYSDPDALDCSPPSTSLKKATITVRRECETLTANIRAGNTLGVDETPEHCNWVTLRYLGYMDGVCTGTFTLDLDGSNYYYDALSACGLMTGSAPTTISVTI
jgi:hypothetical protein